VTAPDHTKNHEYYPTPDELAAYLWQRLLWIVPTAKADQGLHCLEPSAGGGAFAFAMAEDGRHEVTAIEPHLPPPAPEGADLPENLTWASVSLEELHEALEGDRLFDLSCGNPPYSLAEAHLRLLLKMVKQDGHIGFLLRSGFLGSSGRAKLFAAYPPRHVYILSKRPSFVWSHTCKACKHNWRDLPDIEHVTCPKCESENISVSKTDRYDYAFVVWQVGWKGETTVSWLTQVPGEEEHGVA
jgi:hypothetical protein